jgi:hypothetical protein
MKPAQSLAVFHVFLVRPSKYDDEGFVIRHWRAVVPSNSLACLYGLTEDLRKRPVLGEVDLRIHAVDEAVTKLPLDTSKWPRWESYIHWQRPILIFHAPNYSEVPRTQIAEKFLTPGVLKQPEFTLLHERARRPIVGVLQHIPNDVADVDEVFGRCNVIVTRSSIAGQCSVALQERIVRKIHTLRAMWRALEPSSRCG